MEQPSLLFISPVMPAPTGSGIAMRAFSTVRALSNRYRVHLVVTAPDLAGARAKAEESRSGPTSQYR